MPRICYEEKTFTTEHEKVIKDADRICRAYMRDGYTLTVRQLYYQFVARDLFPADRRWRNVGGDKWVRDLDGTPNATPNYKWLADLLNTARLAGRLDWDAIEDRTRNLETLSSWDSAKNILEASARQFRYDRWDSQPVRIEVWVEKEALIGVIERVANEFRVPYFACRGYTSQSEAWRVGQRFEEYCDRGQPVKVLHLGDHDPSGIDMTRDNEKRLALFSNGADIDVIRLALNMNQVREYNPPPNPAKLTDSRASEYVRRFGDDSWELDALDPPVISALVSDAIEGFIDRERWGAAIERENEARGRLQALADDWQDPEE
jgi:hypothetical protein